MTFMVMLYWYSFEDPQNTLHIQLSTEKLRVLPKRVSSSLRILRTVMITSSSRALQQRDGRISVAAVLDVWSLPSQDYAKNDKIISSSKSRDFCVRKANKNSHPIGLVLPVSPTYQAYVQFRDFICLSSIRIFSFPKHFFTE